MKDLEFSKIENIDSLCAVLGLAFPESANEFQKSALTLAHLMASLRDFVLKGHVINESLIRCVYQLSSIMVNYHEHQQ